jgi:hypothetical protein
MSRGVLARLGPVDLQPVAGLVDLWLVRTASGDLAIPERPSVPLSVLDIVDLVRARGGDGLDVRLVAPDGARDRAFVAELAARLRRDVIVSPDGAEVRVAGQPREPRPVDRASGRAVNWTFVQPPDLATDGPSWFELVGSTVLPRSGVVTLPLADGVMVATRFDFPVRRALAARLTVGHANLSTIGVGIDRGTFVVGDYDGRITQYGGREFAAVLSMLPIYHADVRMWLAWPEDDAGTVRLHTNLCEFAAYSGAMVWAPSPGGCAILLDSGDLAAMKQGGTISQWLAYPPDDTRGWKPRFRTSAEGRLVPVAVHVVSVARDPAAEARGVEAVDAALRRMNEILHGLLGNAAHIQATVRGAAERRSPAEARALVEAWQDFHVGLTAARFSPAAATGGAEPPAWSAADIDELAATTSELVDAHHRLRQLLDLGDQNAEAECGQGTADLDGLLTRWRLAQGAELRLRGSLAIALGRLDARDPTMARQLVQLCQALGEHLAVMEQVATEMMATIRSPSPFARRHAALWLRHADLVHDLLELLVLGPMAELVLPAPPVPAEI